MEGLVKELIDEAGMRDITHPRFGAGAYRPSLSLSIHIPRSYLIIGKASETDLREGQKQSGGQEAA
jgi:hypothetical protein